MSISQFHSFYLLLDFNAIVCGQPRNKDLVVKQMTEISQLTTESARRDLRKQYGMKEIENPLFNLSVDLFKYKFYKY